MCFPVDDGAGGKHDFFDVLVSHRLQDVVGCNNPLIEVKICLFFSESYVRVCCEMEHDIMALISFFTRLSSRRSALMKRKCSCS